VKTCVFTSNASASFAKWKKFAKQETIHCY
jgi:hypothetical protein